MRVLEDKITVTQIMTRKVVVGGLSNKFSQILEFFTSYKIHHLPICENDEVRGVISYTDMLKFVAMQLESGKSVSLADLDNVFSVEAVMTKNVVTIHPDALIDDACKALSGGSFQGLPVVGDNKKIVGILSNKDIVRFYNQY